MTDSILFALTLDRIEGIGRVTAGKLLTHFPSHTDLLRYPREQVLARIKGAPNAASLVNNLFNQSLMEQALQEAEARWEALQRREISIITRYHDAWPKRFIQLAWGSRPFLLYLFGAPGLLSQKIASVLGLSASSDTALESTQEVFLHLRQNDLVPAVEASPAAQSFQESQGSMILVADRGMSKLAQETRSQVRSVIDNDGLLCSTFELSHGPFLHDRYERAMVQAALGKVCVVIDPQPDTPEWRAMCWSLKAGCPVFCTKTSREDVPDAVHRLHSEVDYEWLVAACHTSTNKD